MEHICKKHKQTQYKTVELDKLIQIKTLCDTMDNILNTIDASLTSLVYEGIFDSNSYEQHNIAEFENNFEKIHDIINKILEPYSNTVELEKLIEIKTLCESMNHFLDMSDMDLGGMVMGSSNDDPYSYKFTAIPQFEESFEKIHELITQILES
jgi:Na+/phosphate symporter